jgi:hypothetical protein
MLWQADAALSQQSTTIGGWHRPTAQLPGHCFIAFDDRNTSKQK